MPKQRPRVSQRNISRVRTISGVIRGTFDEALTVLLKDIIKKRRLTIP